MNSTCRVLTQTKCGSLRGFTGPTGPTAQGGGSLLKFSGVLPPISVGSQTAFLADTGFGYVSTVDGAFPVLAHPTLSPEYPLPEPAIVNSFRAFVSAAVQTGEIVTVDLTLEGSVIATATFMGPLPASSQAQAPVFSVTGSQGDRIGVRVTSSVHDSPLMQVSATAQLMP